MRSDYPLGPVITSAVAGLLLLAPAAAIANESSAEGPTKSETAQSVVPPVVVGSTGAASVEPTGNEAAAEARAATPPAVEGAQKAAKADVNVGVPVPAGADKTPSETAAATPEAKPEPPKPTLFASINLTSQTMTVRNGDKVVHRWKVSTGRSGYHTPPGKFRPTWKVRMWRSRQYYGAPMPYSVFFNRGIAVHGTAATGLLGRPASHGCVRLATSNARAFYKLVSRHGMAKTRIEVTGKTPVSRRSRYVSRSRTRTYRSNRRYRYRYTSSPFWFSGPSYYYSSNYNQRRRYRSTRYRRR